MGFFFKNKKKNKTEEAMAQASEVTTETTTADGMILSREGIKLGLPSVSMEEAIIAAGELLRDLGYVDDDYIPAMIRRNEEASVYMGIRTCNSTWDRRCEEKRQEERDHRHAVSRRSRI